ncbi:MAG: YqgE/AlgH family protein [Myxococcales bacterium]|nr:YqgE/AlgH family protein [Myxococcales bacterium]
MSDSELAPGLLVAMPQLLDPNFHRAVVFMVEHDEHGSFGLVINRDTEFTCERLCDNLDMEWRGDPERLVSWGGPVQPEHGWLLVGDEASDHEDLVRVTDGVRFSRSPAALRAMARRPVPRLNIFLGYAGWEAGQLLDELIEGAWIVAPASPDLLFDQPRDSLWEAALRGLGIDPATLVQTSGVN